MIDQRPVIHAKNIGKTYRLYARPADRVKETFLPFGRRQYHQVFHALEDVSLQVGRGETVGIIGRNGSGKSTLLQIICGILRPSSGTVEVGGRISALLELGAGFNPEFSGRENVYLNASILGLGKAEIDACFDDIAAFADIGEFIDQPVKTYSSGMYVRLAFAVAINVRPDVLVVDEALSVGDTLFQAKCFAKFREFQEMGVTILFVTHSMDLIVRYCSAAYLLEGGRLVRHGGPKEVVDAYNRLLVDCSLADDDAPPERDAASGEETDDEASRRRQVVRHMRESEQRFRLNSRENRYGNGKAEIVRAGIFDADGQPCQALVQRQVYEFRMEVLFKARVQEPIFAFTIKDVKGMDVSGTNTFYHRMDTGTVEAGAIVRVSFRQRVPLAAGGYILSVGCAGFEKGEYVVHERRFDLLAFEVAADRPVVGLFDMDSRITILHEAP